MDKGPAGQANVLTGVDGAHNYLLGGYGNDTIYGGDAGDVIWGDYHESGWPSFQTAVIHAGNGPNLIYANDTVNYVWTGTNPTRSFTSTRTPAWSTAKTRRSSSLPAITRCRITSSTAAGTSASTRSATDSLDVDRAHARSS